MTSDADTLLAVNQRQSQPAVSVIFPCLNEVRSVATCVREARQVMDDAGLTGEVMVADNGSTDGSALQAFEDGARVVHVAARGHGPAIRGGIAVAQGQANGGEARRFTDQAGQRLSVARCHSSPTLPSIGPLGYSYDLGGRRTQLSAEAGVVGYTYDANNRLIGMTDPAFRSYTFAWDAAGRMTRLDYPNGTSAALTYDAAGQLTEKLHLRGTTLLGENTYVHNRVGNIEGWGTSDGNVRTFAYDPNDRLLAANSSLPSVGNETFAYDQMGNWTPFGGRVHNAANELIEDAGHTYRYDADGNLVEKRSKADASQVTTYVWDPLNRLIEVTTPAHTVRYRYDGMGRRIAKSVNDVETHYVLDDRNVMAEKDASNTLSAFNLHAGLDVLLMRTDYGTGATYWAYTDHLGSVEVLTDATGTVSERYRYTSFGTVAVMNASFGDLSAAPKTPFTYTAREWEPEVGLLFHRARFMDPALGRWLSRDPIGENGGLNLYGYVGNSPINLTDPYGLETTVSLSNGTTTTVTTARALVDAITRAAPDSITDINLAGHANQTLQGIGDDSAVRERVEIDSTGKPVIVGPSVGSSEVDLGALLKGKMSPNGKITFDGCKAGSESKSEDNPTGTNLPKVTSTVVPNTPVSGSSFYTFGPNVSKNNMAVPFTTNTYVNGAKQ